MSTNVKLNQKQKLADKKFTQFLSQSTEKYFYLFGYAGTGKTFLISKLIVEALEENLIECAYVCAPTHVALNVLESYFRSNFTSEEESLKKIQFMTIHRLLEFKSVISNETGAKVFKPTTKSKIMSDRTNKLIIIDECSMIPSAMVNAIDAYANTYGLKIVFLGDSAQLPPVPEPQSLVFAKVPENYAFHIVLDEIMRTKSASIKTASKAVRSWGSKSMSTGTSTQTLTNLVDSLVPIHRSKVTPRTFKLFHKKSDYKSASWFAYVIDKIESGSIPIILTWKNATANMYNQIIREHIHGTTDDLANYKVNDFMIFNNYYESVPIADILPTRFYTSNQIKIVGTRSAKKTLVDWSAYRVASASNPVERARNTLLKKFESLGSAFVIDTLSVNKIREGEIRKKLYVINTISRTDLPAYTELIKNVRKHLEHFFLRHKSVKHSSALWKMYHKILLEPYAEINFSYSMTTHKAQGSTFGISGIDFEDITQNPNVSEMWRALYTAMTRASVELFVVL